MSRRNGSSSGWKTERRTGNSARVISTTARCGTTTREHTAMPSPDAARAGRGGTSCPLTTRTHATCSWRARSPTRSTLSIFAIPLSTPGSKGSRSSSRLISRGSTGCSASRAGTESPLAGVPEPLSDPAQRGRESIVDRFPFSLVLRHPSALSPQQRHLQQRKRIDIGIPERDRRLQHGSVVEQQTMPPNEKQRLDRALILANQRFYQLAIAAQVAHVGARDLDVGLCANHLRLPQQVIYERPAIRHPLNPAQTGARKHLLAERGSNAEPTGEHEADLRPAESPRDGSNAFDACRCTRTVRGARAKPGVCQLIDRRRHAKELKQSVVIVDQLVIDIPRSHRHAIHHLSKVFDLFYAHLLSPITELVQQHSRRRHLQRALGHRQQAELLRDDLPLLGDLDAALGRPGRQSGESAIDGRATTAPDAPATAMEKTQLHSGLIEHFGQRLLRAIQTPRRRYHSGILTRIGVADHYFLLPSPVS